MRPKSPNYYQKNIMVKRILLSIVLLLVIAYLVVAVTAFNRKPTSQVCQDVELVIKDTVYAGFITKKEVATLLEKKGISPIGKDLERVRTKTLERELAKHNEGTAVIDASGAKREVSADLIDDLEVGDYVMVHAGVAIAKITSDDSEETDEIMESIQ